MGLLKLHIIFERSIGAIMIIRLPSNVAKLIALPLTDKGKARIKKEIAINKQRKERERKRKKERERKRIKEKESLKRKQEQQLEESKSKPKETSLDKSEQKAKKKSITKITLDKLPSSTNEIIELDLLNIDASVVKYSEVLVEHLKG